MLETKLGKCESILGGNTQIAESKMAKFKMPEIQDGHHHQVKWEWMSLSQIELVWVRVRVEWECFWVNLREDKEDVRIQDGSVSIQHDRIQDGCHHQIESEWMSEVFLMQMVGTNLGKCEWIWEENTKIAESKMAKFKMPEFKMAAIIKLSENEWVWVRLN